MDPIGVFRVLGGSFLPMDMLWVMETLEDYVEQAIYETNQETNRNQIKENRLLYELGEITKEEYEKRNGKLNHQRKINNRINGTNMNQRINLLDSNNGKGRVRVRRAR
ncbi:MAG: gas vesicle protein GvpG [Candidatus Bathyarchaeota archaeon]|nr:gas vesicle protein GvpG [Candidatus Bathyarchaeota archaeon]